MREWVAFWNTDNSIYVNARHLDVHFRTIADDIARHVSGADAVALDYGCGEALHADRVAAGIAKLVLSDAAPSTRERLAGRFGGDPKIEVCAPEEIEALPDATFDFIVLNSVAQYLSSQELEALLALFHRLLTPRGKLLVGDVVSPAQSMLVDISALVKLAAANGFLLAAMWGLVRTAFSNYRRLRASVGLSLYDEAAMLKVLEKAGFSARRSPTNIGYNPARMTFEAVPRR